jgi:hypothetical protein
MQNIFRTGEVEINALELEDRFVGQLHGGGVMWNRKLNVLLIIYKGFFFFTSSSIFEIR